MLCVVSFQSFIIISGKSSINRFIYTHVKIFGLAFKYFFEIHAHDQNYSHKLCCNLEWSPKKARIAKHSLERVYNAIMEHHVKEVHGKQMVPCPEFNFLHTEWYSGIAYAVETFKGKVMLWRMWLRDKNSEFIWESIIYYKCEYELISARSPSIWW